MTNPVSASMPATMPSTIAACAGFSSSTPLALMIVILLIGGFFRSLQFTSTGAIAYAEVPPARPSATLTPTEPQPQQCNQ